MNCDELTIQIIDTYKNNGVRGVDVKFVASTTTEVVLLSNDYGESHQLNKGQQIALSFDRGEAWTISNSKKQQCITVKKKFFIRGQWISYDSAGLSVIHPR